MCTLRECWRDGDVALPPLKNTAKRSIIALIFASILHAAVVAAPANNENTARIGRSARKPVCGADQTGLWLPQLKGKKIGLLVNPTSRVGKVHLVDYMRRKRVDVQVIFAPEHGFRGEAQAGQEIQDGRDPATGIRVVSLYGKNVRPKAEDLTGLDAVVFDIQDVGVRFYTYLSSLHYLMQACADQGTPVWVFDRPNPNGHFVDGPVLDTAHRSFVGLHPIPVVHGMTLGELARMIVGEGWLDSSRVCSLQVVPVAHYRRGQRYDLPVAPSPNLPDALSVALYPSICFFEGIDASLGRGTAKPFQLVGAPWFMGGDTSFTPASIPGKSTHPPFLGVECRGLNFTGLSVDAVRAQGRLWLDPLWLFVAQGNSRPGFFLPFFDKLAGNSSWREALIGGESEAEVRSKWSVALAEFRVRRAPYLLYPDE